MPIESSEWSSEQELYDEAGRDTVDKLSRTGKSDTQEDIDRRKKRALELADQVINRMFKSAGYAIPLTPESSSAQLPDQLIRLCAAKIAHWQLYNTNGKRDNDKEGDHVEEKYQWAIAMIQSMITDGLPALPDSGVQPTAGPGRMTFSKISPNYTPSSTDEWSN